MNLRLLQLGLCSAILCVGYAKIGFSQELPDAAAIQDEADWNAQEDAVPAMPEKDERAGLDDIILPIDIKIAEVKEAVGSENNARQLESIKSRLEIAKNVLKKSDPKFLSDYREFLVAMGIVLEDFKSDNAKLLKQAKKLYQENESVIEKIDRKIKQQEIAALKAAEKKSKAPKARKLLVVDSRKGAEVFNRGFHKSSGTFAGTNAVRNKSLASSSEPGTTVNLLEGTGE